MFGTREFRFSYIDAAGELQYLYTRNLHLAIRIAKERGGSDAKRAPYEKNKPLTTGHCQICAREIGTTVGLIAHHGYQRPGTGWQTQSCFGARYRSYEVACDALPIYIDMMKRWAKELKANIDGHMAEPPEVINYTDRDWNRELGKYIDVRKSVERPDGFDPKRELTRDDRYDDAKLYDRKFHAEIGNWRMRLDFVKSDIKVMTQRLNDWKEPK